MYHTTADARENAVRSAVAYSVAAPSDMSAGAERAGRYKLTFMELPICVVDAFTSEPFKGNPAGVCLVSPESKLPDHLMANIAMEMKHAETAFLVPREELNQFDLRWFTPEIEVDLCGHATLASAHALWELGEVSPAEPITFHTRSGALGATKSNGEIQLDFPSLNVEKAPLPGVIPGFEKAVFTGNNKMDWLVQLPSEKEVREFQPDIDAIQSVGLRGLMVTAPGDKEYDFVSRFFAPEAGVPEDSVTGSAHCALGPHWAPRLGKTKMSAYQASPRGGEVRVEVVGGRVILSGKAKTVLVGKLRV